MAAALIAGTRTGYSERWQETVLADFADYTTVQIDTQVPARGIANAAELEYVEVNLWLTATEGSPQPTAPVVSTYVDVDGRSRLRINFANSATGNYVNRATWQLWVKLHHSYTR